MKDWGWFGFIILMVVLAIEPWTIRWKQKRIDDGKSRGLL